MGHSSSKQQKKQKSEGDFSRQSSKRQSSKRLNNKSPNSQKTPLHENNIVKNEIKPIEIKNNQIKESESKVNNNSIDANTRNTVGNNVNLNQNIHQTKKDDLDEIKPTELQNNCKDDSYKEIAHSIDGLASNDSIIVHKSSDIELRKKDGSSDLIPVKIVRSASTGGEIGHYPISPRRMSGRESTEFRRRQFYHKMLTNNSLFDIDNQQVTRNSTDCFPVANREFISYYNSSQIKEYDADDYPEEMKTFAKNLEKIETDLKNMSKSEINIHFATLKDDLHNNWRKVYSVNVTDVTAKAKKDELIGRIKTDLDVLNNRYLGRKLLFVKY